MRKVYVLFWDKTPFFFMEGIVKYQDQFHVAVEFNSGKENPFTNWTRINDVVAKTKENKEILVAMRNLSEVTNQKLQRMREKLSYEK